MWCIWCPPTSEQAELGTDYVPFHQWLYCSGKCLIVELLLYFKWIYLVINGGPWLRPFINILSIWTLSAQFKKMNMWYLHLKQSHWATSLLLTERLDENFRWQAQKRVWRSHRRHSQLALVQHSLCCILPSMQPCWLRRCWSMVPQDGLSTLAGLVEGILLYTELIEVKLHH